jgi:hypothetical protein
LKREDSSLRAMHRRNNDEEIERMIGREFALVAA